MKYLRFFIIVLICIFLISSASFSCLAADSSETEVTDTEAVEYPWFIIWKNLPKHEFFENEEPGRPFNVSPRLWYVAHHEPAQAYNVDIAFVGFQNITRELLDEIGTEYARMQGYESHDAWYEANRHNDQERATFSEYKMDQILKWLGETNKDLLEQYLRPEDEYQFSELFVPTVNVTCTLSLERILEIAATPECENVWIDLDMAQPVAGIDFYKPVIEPGNTGGTSAAETEPPTTDAHETSLPQAQPAVTEETTEAPIVTEPQTTELQSEDGRCTSVIVFPLMLIMLVLPVPFIFKKVK